MSTLPDDASQRDAAHERAAYWPLPIARAIPAAIIAIAITFSADHSVQLGLGAFTAFAVTTGGILVLFGLRQPARSRVRPYLVAQGTVSLVLGIAAGLAPDVTIATFFLIVTVWAVLTGALELYIGIRTRSRHVASNDWVAVGAITLVAAVVFLLLPPDLADEFTNADGSTGVLDSAVVAVGLLGAYAAIIGVFLVVAGLSAKWGTRAASAVAEPDGKDAG